MPCWFWWSSPHHRDLREHIWYTWCRIHLRNRACLLNGSGDSSWCGLTSWLTSESPPNSPPKDSSLHWEVVATLVPLGEGWWQVQALRRRCPRQAPCPLLEVLEVLEVREGDGSWWKTWKLRVECTWLPLSQQNCLMDSHGQYWQSCPVRRKKTHCQHPTQSKKVKMCQRSAACEEVCSSKASTKFTCDQIM